MPFIHTTEEFYHLTLVGKAQTASKSLLPKGGAGEKPKREM